MSFVERIKSDIDRNEWSTVAKLVQSYDNQSAEKFEMIQQVASHYPNDPEYYLLLAAIADSAILEEACEYLLNRYSAQDFTDRKADYISAIQLALEHGLVDIVQKLFNCSQQYDDLSEISIDDCFSGSLPGADIIYYLAYHTQDSDLDRVLSNANHDSAIALIKHTIYQYALKGQDLATANKLESLLNLYPEQPTAVNDNLLINCGAIGLCWAAQLNQINHSQHNPKELLKNYLRFPGHPLAEEELESVKVSLINLALYNIVHVWRQPDLAASFINQLDLEMANFIPSGNDSTTPFWLLAALYYNSYYASENDPDLVNSRIENDANPRILKFEVMQEACEQGNDTQLELLKRRGFDINQRHPDSGDTLLHIMARKSQVVQVQNLLNCGADKFIKNRRRQRPEAVIGQEHDPSNSFYSFEIEGAKLQNLLHCPRAKRKLFVERFFLDDHDPDRRFRYNDSDDPDPSSGKVARKLFG